MLDREEIARIGSGKWDLPCPEVEVAGRGGTTPRRVVRGHGTITNGTPGELVLTVYSKMDDLSVGAPSPVQLDLPPLGDLRATDIKGRVWTARRCLSRSARHGGNSGFCSSTWELEETTWMHAAPTDRAAQSGQGGAGISLWFFHEMEFEATAWTELVETVGGEPSSKAVVRDTTTFECAPFQCRLRKHDRSTLFSARSAGAAGAHFETRLLESLQFALMQRCDWTVRQVTVGSETCVTVRPVPRPHETWFWVSRHQDERAKASDWGLMAKYYSFVSQEPASGLHPVSRYLAGLIHASGSTVEAFTLALGTTVEGILDHLYPDEEASPEFVSLVESARAALSEARKAGALECSNSALKTIDRWLGRLTTENGRKSARAKLLALEAQGVVKMPDIEAWETIRNRAVHPSSMPVRPAECGQAGGDPVRLLHGLLNHAICGPRTPPEGQGSPMVEP